LFERVLVAVSAVELDHEPVLPPEHVDLVAGDDLVGLGAGYAASVHGLQELVFEARSGWLIPTLYKGPEPFRRAAG
jgi:hypothetical protein